MKKFLFKILIFFSVILLSILIFFLSYDFRYNKINLKNSDNAIFFWGDSQMQAGFDFERIGQITNKRIYSAARGGAGVYDFLVFTEIVPKGSNVVLSISQLAQLRGRDKNRGGIPFKSLFQLHKNNFEDLFPGIRNNLKPTELFTSKSNLYPYRDTITYHEPLSKFEEIYFSSGDQYLFKQKLFLYGINRLINKNCKLLFIEFPFHPELIKLINQSSYNTVTKKLHFDIMKLFLDSKFDTLNFKTNKSMMYDLSHFNEYGAGLISDSIFVKETWFTEPTVHWLVINGSMYQ